MCPKQKKCAETTLSHSILKKLTKISDNSCQWGKKIHDIGRKNIITEDFSP